MNERVDIPGRTPGQAATLDRLAATTRVVLRPIGAPTALGRFGLAGGTVVFAALQLGWVPQRESDHVALIPRGYMPGLTTFRERLRAVVERDRETLERLARERSTEYLDLADYLLIAEAVLGVPAKTIVCWPGVALAESAGMRRRWASAASARRLE